MAEPTFDGMVDTGELVDLGDLPGYWERLHDRYEHYYRLPDPDSTQLTARRFDESQPAGHRVYISAQRYLSVAMDNHRALLAVLQHHGATHSAPWSLLRPVFESSFFACWVLDPEEGLTRRQRGLRLEVLDEFERRRHIEAFKHVPEGRAIVDVALVVISLSSSGVRPLWSCRGR